MRTVASIVAVLFATLACSSAGENQPAPDDESKSVQELMGCNSTECECCDYWYWHCMSEAVYEDEVCAGWRDECRRDECAFPY